MPRVGAGAAAVGLILVLIGTFLPWLRSGSVYRDSYQSLGVLRELGFISGLVNAWVAMIPAVGITIAVYAIGLRRSAAVVATVLSIIMGTIAGAAAVQGGGESGLVGIASSGPTVTLFGAVLALLGAVVVLVTQRTRAKQQQQIPGGER
jgi:hypothetical protein